MNESESPLVLQPDPLSDAYARQVKAESVSALFIPSVPSSENSEADAAETESVLAAEISAPVPAAAVDFGSIEQPLLCRELSLLAFNSRVLAQAQDSSIPLLERLRFLCIVSSNLDEFFEVRMAWLRQTQRLHPKTPLANGDLPSEVISKVSAEAHKIIAEQYRLFNEDLIPALQEKGIYFYPRRSWSEAQRQWVADYFQSELLAILTPLGLDPSHPFPRLLNKSLNFAVELDGKDAFGRIGGMAIVQAPRILPRVVKLPPEICDGNDGFVFLSSILHAHVHTLFTGMVVKGCYQFRITRNSDLNVGEENIENLSTAIQDELRDRQYGEGVRLEVAENCPPRIYQFLLQQFQLGQEALYRVNGPVNLVRLMSVPDMINRPELKFLPFAAGTPLELTHNRALCEVIRRQDVLLHHPYQSFEPTVRLIQQAAVDPQVVAIKMTIYRTGSNSDLIAALMAAASSGKQVTVVVELMARFDEETNVAWASKLEAVGAHVVYGVFGYKVHAKMALIVRRENGQFKRYAHLGTGNYHQGTSRIYTDFGFMTADEDLTADVNTIFMEITGLGQPSHLRKITQSPFTLYPMLIDSIRNEQAAAKAGKPARIMAKMNSLVEPSMIHALYEASQAGVSIDLVVRGMCVLRPGVKGLSENIRVRSIIGRLLEHSRVFYFENQGNIKLWIASADWMGRNLFRRIETCVPIENRDLQARIIREAFTLALSDNQRAWQMQADGSYQRVALSDGDAPLNMQEQLLSEYQQL
ncbi:polyphosphate kinase 1 [Stenoxybacter acetivorans]|uniref:polyphosphate kinase 1 n=1 Tax=Stenoxybacter acetivorans TaxID=422441 RepID=UPI0009FC2E58|nr:polyphosphate kinase 1 [Stenoxybacter acetivorans]